MKYRSEGITTDSNELGIRNVRSSDIIQIRWILTFSNPLGIDLGFELYF